jgi:hypothetical protein
VSPAFRPPFHRHITPNRLNQWGHSGYNALMAKSVREPVQRVLDALSLNISVKGKYGPEKLAVIAIWAILCLATLAWSMSGTAKLDNPIGAAVELHLISTSGEHWYTVRNTSDFEWTNVHLTLNDQYVTHRKEALGPGDSDRFFTKDFRYLLYVPRARRHSGPQRIAAGEAPGPTATPDMKPSVLIVRADQGAHRVLFQAAPEPGAADASTGAAAP